MAIETAAQPTTAPDTTAQPSVSVVAPAYNEQANLTPLVREVSAALDGTRWAPYEIVLVDDGSTDDTRETMAHLAELFSSVRCLELTRNFGQSHALQAGIDAARGEHVVTIDADLQNDPADIPELLAVLDSERVDCVSGNRAQRHDPLAKRVPSAVQTHLAKATGVDIQDFGCTLKAYDAGALADITIYGEGHRYIPAKLHAAGYRVTERDVNHRERKNGSSHYGAGRLVRGFVDLVWHWFYSAYGTRPMHVFGGLGMLCMALSGVVGGWAVVDKFVFGASLAPQLPRLIAVVGVGLFGLVLFVFGILAEMITKLSYRQRKPYRVRRTLD